MQETRNNYCQKFNLWLNFSHCVFLKLWRKKCILYLDLYFVNWYSQVHPVLYLELYLTGVLPGTPCAVPGTLFDLCTPRCTLYCTWNSPWSVYSQVHPVLYLELYLTCVSQVYPVLYMELSFLTCVLPGTPCTVPKALLDLCTPCTLFGTLFDLITPRDTLNYTWNFTWPGTPCTVPGTLLLDLCSPRYTLYCTWSSTWPVYSQAHLVHNLDLYLTCVLQGTPCT